MPQRTCSIDGCVQRVRARGWCSKHYQRWSKYGDPNIARPTPEERFWAKVNKNGPVPEHAPHLGPCWVWAGGAARGYSRIWLAPHYVQGHKWAWEQENGPVPDGLELDHLCRVRACVRPSHMEPVTHRENLLRGDGFAARYARQTHCKRGHEFNEENTYIKPNGGRHCRVCSRDRAPRRLRGAA